MDSPNLSPTFRDHIAESNEWAIEEIVQSNTLTPDEYVVLQGYITKNPTSELVYSLLSPLLDLVPESQPTLDTIASVANLKHMSLPLNAELVTIRHQLTNDDDDDDDADDDSNNGGGDFNHLEESRILRRTEGLLSFFLVLLDHADKVTNIDDIALHQIIELLVALGPSHFGPSPTLDSDIANRVAQRICPYFNLPEAATEIIYSISTFAVTVAEAEEGENSSSFGLGAVPVLYHRSRHRIVDAVTRLAATDRLWTCPRTALRSYNTHLFRQHCLNLANVSLIDRLLRPGDNDDDDDKALSLLAFECAVTPPMVLYLILSLGMDDFISFSEKGQIHPDFQLNFHPFYTSVWSHFTADGIPNPAILDALVGLGLLTFHSTGPLYPEFTESDVPALFAHLDKMTDFVVDPIIPATLPPGHGLRLIHSAFVQVVSAAILSIPLIKPRHQYIVSMIRQAGVTPYSRAFGVDLFKDELSANIRAFIAAGGAATTTSSEPGDFDSTQPAAGNSLAVTPATPKFYNNQEYRIYANHDGAVLHEDGRDLVSIKAHLHSTAAAIFAVNPHLRLGAPDTSYIHKALAFLQFLLLQPDDVVAALSLPQIWQSKPVRSLIEVAKGVVGGDRSEGEERDYDDDDNDNDNDGNNYEIDNENAPIERALVEDMLAQVEPLLASRLDKA